MTTTRRKPTARTSKPSTANVTGINVTIPTSLHRKLRVKALESGLTMTQAIEAAVKGWVK